VDHPHRTYQPRDTEHSVLHAVIREHLEPFLREASDRGDGHGLPRFVEQEFREFLTCGVLVLGDRQNAANVLNTAAHLALDQGEYAVAHARLAESLESFKNLGDRRGIAFVLEGFAGLAAADAQPRRAHCLAAAATTLRRIIGAGPPPAWRADLERSLGAASRGLSRNTIEEANARGRSMTLPEAIAFALEEPSPPHARPGPIGAE
jgi:non-specific serine/threonine protein kinase